MCRPAAVKYVKYGRSQVMGEDRSGFWASTTQLAYGARTPREREFEAGPCCWQALLAIVLGSWGDSTLNLPAQKWHAPAATCLCQ